MTKPWYRSATVYALAVSIVAHLLVLAGVATEIAEEQAAHFVAAAIPIVGVVADLVAAWGRKRAQAPLTLTEDD